MIFPPARALVVDDEPLARRALHSLMKDIEWIECVGDAEDGPSAIAMINTLEPDVVFLDVRMPGASGLDVLAKLECETVVIFTTAFDAYAVTAFELGAIDYLRKPFGAPRFASAVERAVPRIEFLRRRQATSTAGVTDDQAAETSLHERLSFASAQEQPLRRLFVRDRGIAVPVSVADVIRFEADGDFVAVHVRDRRHLVYVNLSDVASQLDAAQFVRVHRSHIINIGAIRSIAAFDANRLEVRMADDSRIVASRSGTKLLRQRIRPHAR